MLYTNNQMSGFAAKGLLISALMFWLYRNNLNPLNNVLLFLLVIWIISGLLMRTNLFTKNESHRFRRAKTVAFVMGVLTMLLLVSTVFVLNFVDEIGADPQEYNSPHYHDESFHNLNESSPENDNFFETLQDYLVFDRTRTPDSVLPTEKFEIQNHVEDEVSITWFGHSTILIQSREYNILIDPLFGDEGTGPLFLGPAPFDYENTYEIKDLPSIDIVLISHDHYDHLDMKTVIEFEGSTFLTPLGVKPHLELWGIPSVDIMEFDWYGGTNISDELQIILTPSQHFSGRTLSRDPTLWGSWVIDIYDTAIFFGGDGGYSAEFTTIGDLYGPFDIAILEAGQYNEAWSNIHMFPKEVIQASIDLNSSVVMPIHNSKYELALHPWDEPLIEVTAEGMRRNHSVATPMIGQSFVVGLDVPNYHWWMDVEPGDEPFLKSNYFMGLYIPIAIIIAIVLVRHGNVSSGSEEE